MTKWRTQWGEITSQDNGEGSFTPHFGLRQSASHAGTVTIASSAGTSGAFDARPYGPRGLAVGVPSAWTSADIGFDVSTDASTWLPLYGETGSRVKITNVGTALAAVYMAPADCWLLGNYAYFRLASLDTGDGSSEAQAAARSLTVSLLA